MTMTATVAHWGGRMDDRLPERWTETADGAGTLVTWRLAPRDRLPWSFALVVWVPVTILILVTMFYRPIEGRLVFALVLVLGADYLLLGIALNETRIWIDAEGLRWGHTPLPRHPTVRLRLTGDMRFVAEPYKHWWQVSVRASDGKSRALPMAFDREDAELAAARLRELFAHARPILPPPA
jgi:hypothetical protein